MEHYKNLSLENITEVIDGILYTEEWRDIKGFEGYYQCSSFGRVKSLSREVPDRRSVRVIITRIKKQFSNINGYPSIFLNKNKIKIQDRVHRIIGRTFIDNHENKKCINHKNLIRTDNRVVNLEWVTNRENNLHAYANGHKKGMLGKVGELSIYSKVVYQFDRKGSFINKFFGTKEAERITGISHKSIGRVCLGKRPHTHGFVWQYENDLINKKNIQLCQ